jgi:methylthioribulose-1-phosphate dehydratase
MSTIINLKQQLAETVHTYNHKGWSPATSTNYSFMDDSNTIWVSRSGVDKSNFSENDFITVNSDGIPTGEYVEIKPSAETLIHCVLYKLFPTTKVILHSHSVYPLLISMDGNEISFEGYEVQKGFAGETTHENKVTIPVFDNTQDMDDFANTLISNVGKINHHCFIMHKHGTYAWGENLFEAKRHLETLEYLSEISYKSRLLERK